MAFNVMTEHTPEINVTNLIADPGCLYLKLDFTRYVFSNEQVQLSRLSIVLYFKTVKDN